MLICTINEQGTIGLGDRGTNTGLFIWELLDTVHSLIYYKIKLADFFFTTYTHIVVLTAILLSYCKKNWCI